VFEGCPHATPTLELVRRTVDRLAPDAAIERIEVDTLEMASELGFLGSPSVRIDGRDLDDKRTSHGSLCCRTYEGGSGVPPEWLVEAALTRALQPHGLLFLCVGNSARSQIAEGIARSMAPTGVKVWSAGSRPTRVRPEAITVLKEIGIDISRHRSKAVAEIPAAQVDTVITLCGEEECPLFLGKATRLHWGLQDPAAVQSTEQDRLNAFRNTRDELRRRLEALLVGNPHGGQPS
jgi:arsenate reductase